MRNDIKNGSVLFITIVVVILLVGLATAFLTLALSKSQQTEQSLKTDTAYDIVQAGLDMARVVLLNGYTNGWDDELQTSYNNESSYNPEDPPIETGTDPAPFQWARDISYYEGRYWVTVTDNNDGDGDPLDDKDDIVEVRVRAFLPGGDEKVTLTLCRYKPPLYEPDNAVVSGGTLNISGGSTITGTEGSIYANGDINITGAASVEQDAFATGSITGQDNINGQSYEGQSPIDIPDIDPTAYQSLADYELRSNGDVYDTASSTVIGTATPAIDVLGWNYDGIVWTTNSDVADGTYYVPDGRTVEVVASPGTELDPWQTTLLVTGNVIVSSQAVMTPDEPGVVIMARGDVVLSGGVTVQDGMIATHEQMSISGNVDITGMVLMEDAEDIFDLVSTSSEFNISAGTASITYNGGMTTFLDYGDPCVVILSTKIEK